MRRFIFLDYDGTLVPIAATPSEASPPPEVIRLLQQLIDSPGVRVAVISGRSLVTLKDLLPVPGLYLAACHGGIIQIPGSNPYYLKEKPPENTLRDLARDMGCFISGRKGFLMEIKELGIAFHYRQASRKETGGALETICNLFRRHCPEPYWEVITGKEVLEVRQSGIEKGKAALFLLQKWPGAVPFFAGDDSTDEDAFRALAGRGETVLVTDSHCSATAACRQMTRTGLLEYLEGFAAENSLS